MKKINIILLLFLFAAALTSCSKSKIEKTYFEHKETIEDNMDEVKVFLTAARLEMTEDWDIQDQQVITEDINEFEYLIDKTLLAFEQNYKNLFKDIKDDIYKDDILRLDYEILSLRILNWESDMRDMLIYAIEFNQRKINF